jgi:hypothetical protein
MSTAAVGLARTRHNWIATGFEGGIVLLVAGMILLYLNPFWHMTDGGNLDARALWWNAAGESLTAGGLVMLALAVFGSIAALLSRCFSDRPSWPYVLAAVAVGAIVTWVGLDGFTRDFDASFEWNSADGFRVFHLQGSEPNAQPSMASMDFAWRSMVGVQVQPELEGYFHFIDWQRVNGHINVKVVRLIPIAWPVGLGNEGETLEDPDETPLMHATDAGDLKTVQQLLAAKPDVNARDQSGQTALIHACRNPQTTAALVKALLTAGADMNIRGRDDYTALAWATARSNTAVMQALRHAGAKP